jgi:hypothetical protein
MGGSPELEGRLANHEVAAAHDTRALVLRERR